MAFNEQLPISWCLSRVKAALVKNVDEKGRVPYTYRASCNFVSAFFCTVNSPAVPNDRRLVITHVSAAIRTGSPAGGVQTYVLSDGFTQSAFFAPVFVTDDGFTRHYAVNEPVQVYIEAGGTIRVAFSGLTTNGSTSVVVTGYLVDLTI